MRIENARTAREFADAWIAEVRSGGCSPRRAARFITQAEKSQEGIAASYARDHFSTRARSHRGAARLLRKAAKIAAALPEAPRRWP